MSVKDSYSVKCAHYLVAPPGLTHRLRRLAFLLLHSPNTNLFPASQVRAFLFRLPVQARQAYKKTPMPLATRFVLVAPPGIEPGSTV